jgi:hypothetical protein
MGGDGECQCLGDRRDIDRALHVLRDIDRAVHVLRDIDRAVHVLRHIDRAVHVLRGLGRVCLIGTGFRKACSCVDREGIGKVQAGTQLRTLPWCRLDGEVLWSDMALADCW